MKRLAAARVDPGQASGKMGSRATEEEIRMYDDDDEAHGRVTL